MDTEKRREFADWLADMMTMAESSRQYREGYAWTAIAMVRARKMRDRLEKALEGELPPISPLDAFKETKED